MSNALDIIQKVSGSNLTGLLAVLIEGFGIPRSCQMNDGIVP
jgi:hypothetical protein